MDDAVYLGVQPAGFLALCQKTFSRNMPAAPTQGHQQANHHEDPRLCRMDMLQHRLHHRAHTGHGHCAEQFFRHHHQCGIRHCLASAQLHPVCFTGHPQCHESANHQGRRQERAQPHAVTCPTVMQILVSAAGTHRHPSILRNLVYPDLVAWQNPIDNSRNMPFRAHHITH